MNPEITQLIFGDLFETPADTLVIPCSTGGTMSSPFVRGLERLGIPIPTLRPRELGQVDDAFENKYFPRIEKRLLFAVSVDNQRSNYAAIEQIAQQLALRTRHSDIKILAVPLLGTGAGGLGPTEVLRILTETFQRSAMPGAKLLIYIHDEKIYRALSVANKSSSFNAFTETKFYAVGATWDGEDQYLRFIEGAIWENGHSNKFINTVQQVRPDDILILKYSSPENGGYLRIRALGQVLENVGDGHLLHVHWAIRDLEVGIKGLNTYRDTISLINADDVTLMLQRLRAEGVEVPALLGEVPPKVHQVSVPSKIANLVSDAAAGEDYLDIHKDVTAFARVMAYRNFSPPLAIALFGKWGTGKSFFMQKLKDRIDELTQLEDQNDYCTGVAQIHFNAWSYLDANLWASLVSRIFEGLQEYITGDDLAKEHKDAILAQLTSQLVITYEEVAAFEIKKKTTEDKIANLEKAQGVLQDELDKKIVGIKKNTLSAALGAADKEYQAKEKLQEALRENTTLEKDKEALKNIIPEKYWDDPQKFYGQLRSWITFLEAFFKKKNLGWTLAVISFLLVCIFLLPHFLTGMTAFLKSHDFSIPQLQTLVSLSVLLTPTIIRIKQLIARYKPFIAAVWDIKEKHQQAITKANDDFIQQEKSIQLEIRDGEQQLLSLNQQLQQAQSELQRIDYKIKNALATEALYSFIEKRCKSEDYQKMLGIVSIIRKDFQTMSNLFAGHRAEQPDSFDKKFRRPLSRIILYIDDLDRCPEDRVVEVLEAVNLLMAFPLFVVVVGVDPRWVRNALVKRYQLQFSSDDHTYEKMEASDYLEKIFQIPFHLKPASPNAVKRMIRNLTAGTRTISQDQAEPTSEPDGSSAFTDHSTSEVAQPSEAAISQPSLKNTIELSDEEIQFLEELSVVVGSNPRAVKRFVNTYQIVRCHEAFTYMEEEREREFVVCLFLLALPTGKFRDLNDSFVAFFELPGNESKTLQHYFASANKTKDAKINELKHQLNVLLTDKPLYAQLQKQTLNVFKYHYDFIRRFTFEDVDGAVI